MQLDELIEKLGGFGRYQRRFFFLVCLSTLVIAWNDLSMVFIGATPEFTCKMPLSENVTFNKKKLFSTLADSACYYYFLNSTKTRNSKSVDGFNGTLSKTTDPCQNGYDFSKSDYIETIVTEFQLVCDKKFWVQICRLFFFSGSLSGSVIFGQLSDRYGRKTSFSAGCLLLLVAGTVASFSPNLYVFLLMYFCQGAASMGTYMIAFTLSTEIVSSRYRAIVGVVIQAVHSVGLMTLAGIAYFIRQWRYLEMAIIFPGAVFILYWWLLPESVLWLHSRGKEDQMAAIINKISKQNRVLLDSDVVNKLKSDSAVLNKKDYYVIDCVRTWRMAKLSLNIWFIWLVNSLVYIGLSINTEYMEGNPYLLFCIAVAVDIPALILCVVLVKMIGNRLPLVFFMLLGGVACISSECLPRNTDTNIIKMVLVIAGKFCIMASFGITRLMTVELFPTVVRSAGLGVASMFAGTGAALAPVFLDLQTYITSLPLFIFGSMSVVAGALSLLLPETSGNSLPQTLDENIKGGNSP